MKNKIDKKTKDAVKKIIDYLYADEKKHFEETPDKEKKFHIFNNLETVKNWLNTQKQKTNGLEM